MFYFFKCGYLENLILHVAYILFPFDSIDMGRGGAQWKHATFITLAFVSG